jgi:dolichol kinase
MSAVARASRAAATDLGALLRELDDGAVAAAAARLRQVRASFARLVERTFPEGDEQLRERLTAVAALLRVTPKTEAAWYEFRDACRPALEALLAELSAEARAAERPRNLVRNAYHVANALFVVFLVERVLPDDLRARIGVAGAAAAAAWGMELSRRWSPRVNGWLMALFAPVAHAHEAHRINSATWYTTAVLVLAVAFRVETGAAALLVLGFGDPAAALVGRRFGRVRLANGRSLEGSLAFVVAGFVGAFWGLSVFHPAPPDALVVKALVAVGAGALAELFVRGVDDNLAVPIAAASALGALSFVS